MFCSYKSILCSTSRLHSVILLMCQFKVIHFVYNLRSGYRYLINYSSDDFVCVDAISIFGFVVYGSVSPFEDVISTTTTS